jgi:glycine/D-amino acid oxidase-like deaminating enzyme
VTKRVVIIGSGIIGASLAWHLTRNGADVRVLDTSSELGGLATPNSWAWINASWGNDRTYFNLRNFAMNEWWRCDRQVPGLSVNRCGSLLWDLPQDKLMNFVAEHASWGYDIELVDSQRALELEPHLLTPPAHAAHARSEASVEPRAAALAFLNDARRNGAELLTNARVKWLRERSGRIDGVMTTEGDIDADEIVIAAGTGTNELLKSIGMVLDMSDAPGLLMQTTPEPEVLNGLLVTPTMEVRQSQAGQLIVSLDPRDNMKNQNPAELAEAMLIDLRKLLRFEVSPAVQDYATPMRPMPSDSRPCLGRPGMTKGLYIAVTHSGITLAPAVGSLCAADILDGDRSELLAAYSPDRLLGST